MKISTSNCIDVYQASAQLSRLLERAHAGEEIVLSKAGIPYAKLVPLEKPKRKLGFIKGHVDDAFFNPLPGTELDGWEGR